MESEEMLLETLKDWRYLNKKLARLKEREQERGLTMTSTMSHTKTFVIGRGASQVESFYFAQIELARKIEELEDLLKSCQQAYKKADLTHDERLAIQYTCNGKSLRELAGKLEMAQARIYRIRDRAVRKMFIEIQNERKK